MHEKMSECRVLLVCDSPEIYQKQENTERRNTVYELFTHSVTMLIR